MLFVNQHSKHSNSLNRVARCFVAAILPILLYMAAIYYTKCHPGQPISAKVIEYDKYIWIVIAIVALVYPLDQISLYLLFEPIEHLCDWAIRGDLNSNPFLKGPFAPISHEHSYEIKEPVVGKVPTDVNGVFLRNTPNPRVFPRNGRHHWVDGDAMIHAVRIKNGHIYYCNR